MADLYERTRRELSTDKGVIRYHVAGPDSGASGPNRSGEENDDVLLLLHGSGPGVTGWRNFRGNLEFFAQTHRVYIIEFPGFGVSDPVDGHPVLTAGTSVIDFMDGLGIERAAVIGNSMGGVVGINLAIKFPERITKLVTIGGVGPNVFSPSPSEGLRLLQEFTDEPDRDKLVRWLGAMVYDRALVTDELIEERWAAATDPAALATATMMYGSAAFEMGQKFLANTDTPPYWARMHKVSCPTLLTWGRDDRVSPPDMAMVPMRLIPDAQLHIFPKCGHWVMIEAKEAFEATVAAFLSQPEP